MKVILLGTTGMVGQGVLRECLRDPGVERVLSLGRNATGAAHEKLRELLHKDLYDLSSIEDQLSGYDACFFCLGVSSAGMSEAEYRRVTYDLTLSVARTLHKLNPGMTFIYVSGTSTDSTEKGRTMWARVKGATENALLSMGFKAAYMFRPGIIQPLGGIRPRSRVYRGLQGALAAHPAGEGGEPEAGDHHGKRRPGDDRGDAPRRHANPVREPRHQRGGGLGEGPGDLGVRPRLTVRASGVHSEAPGPPGSPPAAAARR